MRLLLHGQRVLLHLLLQGQRVGRAMSEEWNAFQKAFEKAIACMRDSQNGQANQAAGQSNPQEASADPPSWSASSWWHEDAWPVDERDWPADPREWQRWPADESDWRDGAEEPKEEPWPQQPKEQPKEEPWPQQPKEEVVSPQMRIWQQMSEEEDAVSPSEVADAPAQRWREQQQSKEEDAVSPSEVADAPAQRWREQQKLPPWREQQKLPEEQPPAQRLWNILEQHAHAQRGREQQKLPEAVAPEELSDEELAAHKEEVKKVLEARPWQWRTEQEWLPILLKIDWSYDRKQSIYDYLTYKDLPSHCFRKDGRLLYNPPPVAGGGVWRGQEWRPGKRRYGKRGGRSLQYFNNKYGCWAKLEEDRRHSKRHCVKDRESSSHS